jgi:hypothetical protein
LRESKFIQGAKVNCVDVSYAGGKAGMQVTELIIQRVLVIYLKL